MSVGDIIVGILFLLFVAAYVASWIIALRYKREQAQQTPETIFEKRIQLLQELLDEKKSNHK